MFRWWRYEDQILSSRIRSCHSKMILSRNDILRSYLFGLGSQWENLWSQKSNQSKYSIKGRLERHFWEFRHDSHVHAVITQPINYLITCAFNHHSRDKINQPTDTHILKYQMLIKSLKKPKLSNYVKILRETIHKNIKENYVSLKFYF